MEGNARYSMATPDEAWWAKVDAWDLVPEERIRQDIRRFRLAVNAIIAAKGVYVKDCHLQDYHRKVIQDLVRGRSALE